FRPRIFAAFLLFSAGICLGTLSFKSEPAPARARSVEQERYLPVPGGGPDDLDRLEAQWNDRVTYPTGRFNPAWLRVAAAADARITRGVPFGATENLRLSNAATTLDPTNFTSLGPRPLRMTGCSGCYD